MMGGQKIEHCPFCGDLIEVKETARVKLKNGTKTVPNGYEEVERTDI